jgi:hypothetical protein
MKITYNVVLVALVALAPLQNKATRILVKNCSNISVKVSYKSKNINWIQQVNKGKSIKKGRTRKANDIKGIVLDTIIINNETFFVNAIGPYFVLIITPGDMHHKFNYELYKATYKNKIGELIQTSQQSFECANQNCNSYCPTYDYDWQHTPTYCNSYYTTPS